jgi:hypothetical protein
MRQCPTVPRFPGDLAGCGSTNVSQPDKEGVCDCHNCGMWFRADDPCAQVARSISDNDLCSECLQCRYKPGELSTCDAAWPGVKDDDYIVACAQFIPIKLKE